MILYNETTIGNPLYFRMSHAARAQAVKLKVYLNKVAKMSDKAVVIIKMKIHPGVKSFLKEEVKKNVTYIFT